MHRVLLVLEDFNEQLFLETLLKKLGFDVASIRSEASLSDQLLITFQPELIISTGDGVKIQGGRVAKKAKKKAPHVKLLLLYLRSRLKDISLVQLEADGAIEIPINPRIMITSICQLIGIELQTVMSKFEKLPVAKDYVSPAESMHIIQGKQSPFPTESVNTILNVTEDKERVNKYIVLLKDLPETSNNGFNNREIQAHVTEIRKYEKENKDVKVIDEQRQEFVKALFKK